MLYPMFAMVLLTFIVSILSLKARLSSVRSKQIKPAYFLLMNEKVAGEIPERVRVTTRAVNNMYELPVLFYLGAVMAVALELESTLTIITAWIFILSRYIHAWIHLTYNNIIHRMRIFSLGFITVLVLWIELLVLSL